MSKLSRRELVVTSTAAVLALPAIAAPVIGAADDPIIELAERAVAAWHALGDACTACDAPETAIHEWRRANPFPKKGGAEAIARWDEQKRAVEQKTGYTKSNAARTEAGNLFHNLIDELSNTVPRTTDGLLAKARACLIVNPDDTHNLGALGLSIVEDIMEMFGGEA